MSKLFDKLKSAARSRAGTEASAPSTLLSHALRRAADERAALRAVSPGEIEDAIDLEAVELSRIEAEAEAQERLAAAARESAEAEQLALETAKLRAEAEEREAALAAEESRRLESTARRMAEASGRSHAAASERRRVRRALFFAVVALVVIGAIIFTRAFTPDATFGEPGAPLYKLDRELRTAPETAKE
ncbi:MAG: hypothetical protein WA190_12125 [Usitatibacter sp.]